MRDKIKKWTGIVDELILLMFSGLVLIGIIGTIITILIGLYKLNIGILGV